jgi:hypothetical protein
VITLLRYIHESTVNSEVNAQLYSVQAEEYLNRQARAEHIKSKYEIITREYGDQNKQFAEKHLEIMNAEV